tara:strand:+ start:650 stop:1765 length:1116 start_codon:yes stop_codon:yes gene_type:complete
MSCSKDKKKAFLTKPKARIRNRLKEQEEKAREAANTLNGQTVYRARVISVPRANQAVVITTSADGDEEYNGVVKVRIKELDRSLPNPLESSNVVEAILNHQDAYVSIEQILEAGDIVEVTFAWPPVGVPKFVWDTPVVTAKISSDESYAERLRGRFSNTKFGDYFTSFGGSKPLAFVDASKHPPYVAEYTHPLVGKIKIENGKYNDWPDKIKDYYDKNITDDAGNTILIYQGGGDNGNFFLKHTTINYATQLKLLAIEYYTKYEEPLRIASGARSYEKQLRFYYDDDPTPAAIPGHSNHGWALAIDLHPRWEKANYESAKTKWILGKLNEYHFSNAEGSAAGTKGEAWHHTALPDEMGQIIKIDYGKKKKK